MDSSFINKKNAHLFSLSFENGQKINICLRTSISTWKNAHMWGDYHFAIALRKSLVRLGYLVSIQTLEDTITNDFDVILHLRGLKPLITEVKALRLMWNISHPEMISNEEYNSFDHVFIASQKYASILKNKVQTPVSELLQCSDPSVFKMTAPNFTHEVVFIGNSRNQYRQAVQYAVESGVDFAVYGSNWDKFIDKKYIKGEYVSNSILKSLYSSAKFVLNDHWADMRENGFISNRIFDAHACNIPVFTDDVIGMKDLFPDGVFTYKNQKEFKMKLTEALTCDAERTGNLRENILNFHTFDHRAKKIDEIIKQHL